MVIAPLNSYVVLLIDKKKDLTGFPPMLKPRRKSKYLRDLNISKDEKRIFIFFNPLSVLRYNQHFSTD